MKKLSIGTEERTEITLFKTEVKLNMLIQLEDHIRNYKMKGRTWHMFHQAGTILVQNSQGPTSNVRRKECHSRTQEKRAEKKVKEGRIIKE